MAKSRRYTVRYRRAREGKTNYKHRLKALSSTNTRLVVRKKLNILIVQLIDYVVNGDKVIVSATSRDLVRFGWNYHLNNLPASYLLGYLIGRKSKGAEIKRVIFDIGSHASVRGSSLYSVLKGVMDSGINISVNKGILPPEDRIKGKHIEEYAVKIKNTEAYKRQFSECIKKNINPEEITKKFEEVKRKIEAR